MSSYGKLIRDATKPKPGAPKAKYIDPIIASSFSNDGSLQDMCKALAQRLNDNNSLVVFRSLVVVHTLIRNGNVDNVLSYISSQPGNLRLRSVSQGGNWQGYDAPKMLGDYASYLEERVRAYREMGHDVIRSADIARSQGRTPGGSRGRNVSSGFDSVESGQRLRKLTVEKGLLREVHVCQKVCSRLLDLFFTYFSDNPADELAAMAFRMAFKDLFALYAAINEGVINVLEHYFEMAKSDAQQALDTYKRFCAQTEKIVAYMQTAKRISASLNMNIPNLRHAPVSLAGALKEYIDDPNFEKNRLEYKENKRVADGGARKPAASTTASTTGKAADAPKDSNSKSIKIQEPTAEERARPIKPPTNNQAVQDFFESIDTSSNQMSMFGGNNSAFMMPQMTGMPGGLAPQMTGYNPFFFQQQQQQQPAFLQTQSTGFIQPQPTGFGMPGQAYQQPQMTGFNPFRQSMMMPQMTGMPAFGSSNGNGMQQPGLPDAQNNQQQQHMQGQSQKGSSANASSALDSFNSAFSGNGAQPSSSNPPTTSNGTKSPPVAGPLSAQKTGSRNPFAPPPGSTPPPKPAQNLKTGPTLYELAFGGTGGTAGPTAGGGGSYGLGAGAWNGSGQQGAQDPTAQQTPQPTPASGLVPQKTGLIGSIASEFVTGNAANSNFGNSTQSSATESGALGAPTPAAPGATNNGFSGEFGLNGLSSGFSGLSVGGQAPSSMQVQSQQQAAIQPQPTGFGGSQVRPFKPESSFGQSLAANGGTVPSPIPAHLTGNPFARPAGGAIEKTQEQEFFSAGAPQSLGTSNSGVSTSSATGNTPQPQSTGFGGSFFGSSSLTGGGNVGTPPTGNLPSQATGFGNSFFRSSSGATSTPAPFGSQQSQPAQQQQSLGSQPTGFANSTVRPFQPTSAFGAGAFGLQGTSGSAQQQPQQPQQQSQPFQSSVPTGSLF